MNSSESSERLTRWRLPSTKFDFVIKFLSGRVHQVANALSQLICSYSNSDSVNDDIPFFDDPLLLSNDEISECKQTKTSGYGTVITDEEYNQRECCDPRLETIWVRARCSYRQAHSSHNDPWKRQDQSALTP